MTWTASCEVKVRVTSSFGDLSPAAKQEGLSEHMQLRGGYDETWLGLTMVSDACLTMKNIAANAIVAQIIQTCYGMDERLNDS
jgi:hypothetical protein